MNTFPTLLKREFWEHKGGMLWAPTIVGGIMALFAIVSAAFGIVMARENMVSVNGAKVTSLSQVMAADEMREAAHVIAFSYFPTLLPFLAVLTFVVLFYSLGSLYDDRRDRSVLFWKSMPISDTQTVLSKLLSILVIAPSVSMAIGLAFGVFLILLSLTAAATLGGNLFGAVLGSSAFYLAPLSVLAVLPVYMLWAFPSVAWFMAVSAWAKRAPFLWAVGVPVLAGILLTWAEAMFKMGLDQKWFWEHIVGRLFGSIVPGMWFALAHDSGALDYLDGQRPESLDVFQGVAASYATLATPTVWIGLVVGAALIVAAIRLRRFREDAA